VLNIILLVPVAIGFGQFRFASRTDDLVRAFEQRAATSPRPALPIRTVSQEDLALLPPPVATWLETAGVVGRRQERTVHLVQRGRLQTSPSGAWMAFEAEQWVALAEPEFLWIAQVKGPAGFELFGRDRYVGGQGSMRIEALGLIPVVDADGPTIDQGALVRFLAELVWYPSAALSANLTWESQDGSSARATLRYRGVEGSGVFYFGDSGDVLRFEAKRYRESELCDWIIDNDPTSFHELDSIRVPTRSRITWGNVDGKPWTWFELELLSITRDRTTPARRMKELPKPGS
jgi:hypothetical protein